MVKKTGSVAGLAVIALTLSLTMCGANDEADDEAAVAGDPANVPPEYLAAVKQAGSICPEITPSIIAAQIAAESNWRPDARSHAGARGISQFMPATWKTHGRDGDGDGRADITNPTDAIISQGYYMCELVDVVRPMASEGGSTSGQQPAPVRAALAKVGQKSYSGRCEQFVRESFGFPGRYASANIAWQQAGDKHPGDANPPAGVPVFWDLTSGPNAAHDHIALSIGGGRVVSTSVGEGRSIGIISIADYTAQSGVTYRGWAGIYHGQNVRQSAPAVSGPNTNGGDIVDLALAAYNAGPGAVQRARGVPHIKETREYVTKIKNLASTTYAPTASTTVPADTPSPAPVEWAKQQEGKPYRTRGCKAPSCYDCCSLVHDAYKHTLGIDLPMHINGESPARSKCENAMLTLASSYGGTHIPATLEQLQPGDIVFFQARNIPASTDTVTHVAIYAGDGQVIDAIPTGGVGIRPLSYYHGSDDLLPHAVRIPQK